LEEQRGALAAAAQTWNQLAMVNNLAGKPEAAETWYRKAIDGFRSVGDTHSPSKCLGNLADLLQTQPGRLDEARQLAEEALAIIKTLDPGAAEIWKTYTILAEIADQQSQPDRAAEYRRLARQAKRNFAGTAHEMKRHLPVILGTWQAVRQPDKADEFYAFLSQMENHGLANLVGAIRKILSGERNEESLCKDLNLEASMIIATILQALEDPSILQTLRPEGNDSE